MKLKIIKIFNNNSIAALSDELGDIILTGSGIGFQKKIGDLVDESRIEKTYIFKEKVEKRIRRGINDIEPIYYEITSLLVSKATEQLNTQFYGEIFLAISDHIAFAIKRKKEKIDFILAVGGGSVIDCCKVISSQAVIDEDIWDLEYVHGKFPTEGIPMGAIVTASGTGAEMNGGAVITHEEKNWKGGIFASTADFAVLDPAYTLTVPSMQVLSGAFDTLSHALETYLGNSDQDNVSDDVALAIMKNTVVNMRRLLKDINDEQARSNLMWDSAMAENGILKCGRQTDFQVHQIEHQLGAFTDCNHGQGLAVIQPVYCYHILNDAREKLTRFAQVVFDQKTAEEGLEALQNFIKECHLPTTLPELKSKVEITNDLLKKVADTTNLIKTNPRTLTKEEVYDILLECM